jgi:hypothetical protein
MNNFVIKSFGVYSFSYFYSNQLLIYKKKVKALSQLIRKFNSR